MFTRVLAAGLGAVIAVSGILAVGNSAAASAEKASICHVDDDGGADDDRAVFGDRV